MLRVDSIRLLNGVLESFLENQSQAHTGSVRTERLEGSAVSLFLVTELRADGEARSEGVSEGRYFQWFKSVNLRGAA